MSVTGLIKRDPNIGKGQTATRRSPGGPAGRFHRAIVGDPSSNAAVNLYYWWVKLSRDGLAPHFSLFDIVEVASAAKGTLPCLWYLEFDPTDGQPRTRVIGGIARMVVDIPALCSVAGNDGLLDGILNCRTNGLPVHEWNLNSLSLADDVTRCEFLALPFRDTTDEIARVLVFLHPEWTPGSVRSGLNLYIGR
jgi:hypothetical protein